MRYIGVFFSRETSEKQETLTNITVLIHILKRSYLRFVFYVGWDGFYTTCNAQQFIHIYITCSKM